MAPDTRFRRALTTIVLLSAFFSCSPQWIRPNPPSQRQPATGDHAAETTDTVPEVNFDDAFDPSIPITLPDDTVAEFAASGSAGQQSGSRPGGSYAVPTGMVRIALLQNTAQVVVYSVGMVRLHSSKKPASDGVRGRILFVARKGNRVRMLSGKRPMTEVALPCTLRSDKSYNFIEFGDATYRGALILTAGRPGTFTVVNYLEVEEYLRGVVPLELGKRSREEIEALKAQAVAARTYTYRRILERIHQPFDLVATVADQVYGGVDAEYRESDRAVRATRNLILTYGDSIITAYYHSTCGGTTANVHEVWEKPARPYLVSVSDLDGSGKAWCRASAYFSWEETWPWKQFSKIVTGSLRKVFPRRQFKGVVNSVTINKRYPCGRVANVTITGSGWAQECGGDKTRFVFRRGTAGNPILRSANFTRVPTGRSTVTFKGRGYGHGVGMCQMGAIGRAQAGQDFRTILSAYYSGVSLREVRPAE